MKRQRKYSRSFYTPKLLLNQKAYVINLRNIYPFTFFSNLPNEFENLEETKIDTSVAPLKKHLYKSNTNSNIYH